MSSTPPNDNFGRYDAIVLGDYSGNSSLGVTPEAAAAYARVHLGFKERLEQLPGVQAVGIVDHVPLNEGYIREQAANAKRILVVDEGRRSAGVGEGVITALAEGGYGARPFGRVVGADTFTPLAGAAFLVIPSEDEVVAAAEKLA